MLYEGDRISSGKALCEAIFGIFLIIGITRTLVQNGRVFFERITLPIFCEIMNAGNTKSAKGKRLVVFLYFHVSEYQLYVYLNLIVLGLTQFTLKRS